MTNFNYARAARRDRICKSGSTPAREDSRVVANALLTAYRQKRAANTTDPVHEQMLKDAADHRAKRQHIQSLARKLADKRAQLCAQQCKPQKSAK